MESIHQNKLQYNSIIELIGSLTFYNTFKSRGINNHLAEVWSGRQRRNFDLKEMVELSRNKLYSVTEYMFWKSF